MPDATDGQAREERRSRTRADRTDRLLSGAAGVVAASALLVSVYQTYITRQQQKLSAWPYLIVSNRNTDGAYERTVLNAGVGPALVRSVTLTVDGRPMRTWSEVGVLLFGDSVGAVARRDSARLITSTVRRGSVILPGATVTMLRVTGRLLPDSVGDVLQSDRARLRFCYCSLYGECWAASNEESEPAAVRACEADDRSEFDN